jgi:hypothetical protein
VLGDLVIDISYLWARRTEVRRVIFLISSGSQENPFPMTPLISATGVPNKASSPLTFRTFPFLSSSVTLVSPIGLGRRGLLVPKRPARGMDTSPFGCTFRSYPWLRSNMNRISSSVSSSIRYSPSENSGKTSISETSPSTEMTFPMGVSRYRGAGTRGDVPWPLPSSSDVPRGTRLSSGSVAACTLRTESPPCGTFP